MLFDELESSVNPGPDCSIRRLPMHINEPEFARALVEEFFAICPESSEVSR